MASDVTPALAQCEEQRDSTFASAEYEEYEREFARYTQDNLRTAAAEIDFAEEFLDDEMALRVKIQTLADWWREARRVVVYTGAGISTAAGLPDYRGPQGVWTKKLRGETADESMEAFNGALEPTGAHRAIMRLHNAGRVTALLTTNVDGLHLASGVPQEVLCELHGNAFVEECRSCGARFERDFVTRTSTGLFDHGTGRSCDRCGGALYDNIVNFGNTFEHVPTMEAAHDRAWVECLKADLCVVLGSSLSVQTACDLPEVCLPRREDKAAGGRLVIVNRQRTPKDELASLRIFATCDDVMAGVETELFESLRSSSGSADAP
mmetsp:Transcript_13329/g.35753  ORF Transcript_13329/g.35753 Transcript_13329/m.35753 type:complete len:322 (+) Transcript_13329:51-1016(+)